MRHYEIVFIVHPDCSDQVPTMLQRYQDIITKDGGKIHHKEDWGRRALAYPINKIHKGHYLLMNVQCDDKARKELKSSFDYNDAVIRHLILAVDNAITEPSFMMAVEDANKSSEKSAK